MMNYDVEIEKLQRRVAGLKKKKKQEHDRRAKAIGEAIFEMFPKVESLFDKDDFDAKSFCASEEFQRALYLRVNHSPQRSEWATRQNDKPQQ